MHCSERCLWIYVVFPVYYVDCVVHYVCEWSKHILFSFSFFTHTHTHTLSFFSCYPHFHGTNSSYGNSCAKLITIECSQIAFEAQHTLQTTLEKEREKKFLTNGRAKQFALDLFPTNLFVVFLFLGSFSANLFTLESQRKLNQNYEEYATQRGWQRKLKVGWK